MIYTSKNEPIITISDCINLNFSGIECGGINYKKKNNEKYCFLDDNYNEMCCEYDHIIIYERSNIYVVRNNGLCGILDSFLNVIIPLKYVSIEYVESVNNVTYLKLCKKNSFAIVDSFGNILTEFYDNENLSLRTSSSNYINIMKKYQTFNKQDLYEETKKLQNIKTLYK